MTVALRPHHLLCLLTYAGKGYTPAFTANFDDIARRLAEGEAIRIVEGPDDICTPLLDEADAHCHRDSVTQRDARAAESLSQILGQPLSDTTVLPDLATLRAAFSSGEARPACAGCPWFDLCSDIAGSGFDGVRLPSAQA